MMIKVNIENKIKSLTLIMIRMILRLGHIDAAMNKNHIS